MFGKRIVVDTKLTSLSVETNLILRFRRFPVPLLALILAQSFAQGCVRTCLLSIHIRTQVNKNHFTRKLRRREWPR